MRLLVQPIHNDNMLKKRLLHVFRTSVLLFVSGGAYGILFHYTGIGMICIFRLVTGLKCPGCGVTHMCIALLHLDFAAAFEANPAVLLISPLLAVVFVPYLICYIRTGHWKMYSVQNFILWICILILILYGIARNISILSI